MEIGIIGLPNVGKSTVFSLITKISVSIDKFPFTTIQPNIGVVEVPDERLDFIASYLPHKKKTYATIKFVDIAGLIKGASKGEGLGNKFLANIREVDGVVHVLRYFFDTTVSSSINKVDPIEEIEIITTELLLADIEVLQNYISKLEPKLRSGEKLVAEKLQLAKKIIDVCNNCKKLSEIKSFIKSNIVGKDKEVDSLIKQLLITKDMIFLLNYDETVDRTELENKIKEISNYTGIKTLPLCAKFELNLLEFPPDEHKELRKEYSIPETEIKNFIQESVKSLKLITFYTIVGDEFRAWFIKEGSSILTAAGKIHSDMEEGFINAEVIEFDKFKEKPDLKLLYQHGFVKICGKDYIVKDGDIIKINFRSKA